MGITVTIQDFKNGKTTGVDGIPARVLKEFG